MCAGLALLFVPSWAFAAPITLNIVEELSFITISGAVTGLPTGVLGPQGPLLPASVGPPPFGSDGMTAHLTGTIEVDITFGLPLGTIAFPGGSVVAAINSSDAVNGWAPESGGGPTGQSYPAALTTDPANYGFNVDGVYWSALRGFAFDLVKPPNALQANTSFSALITFPVLSGVFSYTDTVNGLVQSPGSQSIAGISVNNSSLVNGTVESTPELLTMTIPITMLVTRNIGGKLYNMTFEGTIVATDPAIPEPATFALGALGLIGLLAVLWRRRRVT